MVYKAIPFFSVPTLELNTLAERSQDVEDFPAEVQALRTAIDQRVAMVFEIVSVFRLPWRWNWGEGPLGDQKIVRQYYPFRRKETYIVTGFPIQRKRVAYCSGFSCHATPGR
jgi:hypothetical protein